METRNRIIAAAVLMSLDHQILLGKPHPGGAYPDCWHIPGGGAEPYETLRQALVREVKEEVGIDISNLNHKLLSDTDTGTSIKTDKQTGEQYQVEMKFNTFQINLPTNAINIKTVLSDDLVEIKWVPVSELKNYKHTPPSEKLFHNLGWI